MKAFDILKESPELMTTLHNNVSLFRTEMQKLGFEVMGNPASAIVPSKFN